jgi:hypothetical protein
VAGASVEFKRLLLRGIGWDASKAGVGLRDALQAACQARLEENRSGLALVGAKGNGAEITFGLPQMSSRLTPATIVDSVSQLYDIYEDAVFELGVDQETVTDESVLARMLTLLQPRTSTRSDYSLMSRMGDVCNA